MSNIKMVAYYFSDGKEETNEWISTLLIQTNSSCEEMDSVRNVFVPFTFTRTQFQLPCSGSEFTLLHASEGALRKLEATSFYANSDFTFTINRVTLVK